MDTDWEGRRIRRLQVLGFLVALALPVLLVGSAIAASESADKSLRSSPLEREWAGNERASIKQYEEAFTDFIALPQVPRHLGYRRGWDGPPCSRSVAVLRCKLSKPLWSLLR
jgi:hypothetical protein